MQAPPFTPVNCLALMAAAERDGIESAISLAVPRSFVNLMNEHRLDVEAFNPSSGDASTRSSGVQPSI